MREQPCLLCLVAQGKIQAQKVFEGDRTIAVMNTREPQARGHVVIFPKHHATALHEMDSQDLGEVAVVARTIANAQGLENYNLLHNAGALAGQRFTLAKPIPTSLAKRFWPGKHRSLCQA